MFKLQSRWFPQLLLSLSLLMLLILVPFGRPAHGLMRETVEKPGQVVYQSRQTLKDENSQTWQIVLFKRVKAGDIPEANLRLVGFPGTTSFQHPAPLIIHPDANSQFELADAFAEDNPGENVGQYIISETFQTSPPNSIWQLDLPLRDHTDHIKVPYFVLQEWQELLAKR